MLMMLFHTKYPCVVTGTRLNITEKEIVDAKHSLLIIQDSCRLYSDLLTKFLQFLQNRLAVSINKLANETQRECLDTHETRPSVAQIVSP